MSKTSLSIVDQIAVAARDLLVKGRTQERRQDAWNRLVAISDTGYGAEEFISTMQVEKKEFPPRIMSKAISSLARIARKKLSA